MRLDGLKVSILSNRSMAAGEALGKNFAKGTFGLFPNERMKSLACSDPIWLISSSLGDPIISIVRVI